MTTPTPFAAGADEIRIDLHFDLPKERLWAAITNPGELSTWLVGECSIAGRVGGAVSFDIPEDGRTATGIVRSFDPPRVEYAAARVEHTFVDAARPDVVSVCCWTIVDAASGCDVHFTHDGFEDVDRDRLASTWRRLGPETTSSRGIRQTTSLDDAIALLESTRTILLVSYIGPEVPSALVGAGFDVIAKTGRDPDEWASCAVRDGELVTTLLDAPPEHVDLVHLDWTLAFDEYVRVAADLGAATFWYHSARTRPPAPADTRGCWVPVQKSRRQREIVEAASMKYVDDLYLADVAPQFSARATA